MLGGGGDLPPREAKSPNWPKLNPSCLPSDDTKLLQLAFLFVAVVTRFLFILNCAHTS